MSRPALAPAGGLIALLILICLLPRAFMAWRADVMTEDGPVYIVAATALAQRDFVVAFRHTNLGLNLFPVMLLALHKLGVDWELAGRLWSTLMAVLVVPPLFGLVRRQFSDRVATVGCLLYASHACLIERSPEMLRCPTFWCLLMCTLYFVWRGVTEVRIRHFLLAGLFLTLGAYTRIEAGLAVVPWCLWSLWRWRALRVGRSRLLLGCLLGWLVFPALTVLVNVTWLRDHSRWETCFTQRVVVFEQLWKQVQGTPPATPVVVETPAVQEARPPAPFGLHGEPIRKPQTGGQFLGTYTGKLVDAVDPIYGLLMLLGLLRWRQVAWQRDQLAMDAMIFASLGLVMAFWYLRQEIQGRYFFPLVLTMTPYMAGGVLCLAEFVTALATRLRPSQAISVGCVQLAVLTILGIVGSADALTNKYHDRRERRDLGQWVLQTLGPNQSILGPEPGSMVLAYYARAQFFRLPIESIGTPRFQEALDSRCPSLVVIPKRRGVTEDPWQRHFQADARLRMEFRRVPPELLPENIRTTTVLVRSPAFEQLASRFETFD